MSFEDKVEEAKKPRTELEGFGTEKARDLEQALDIINSLTYLVTKNKPAFFKLMGARDHIDNLIREHLKEEK